MTAKKNKFHYAWLILITCCMMQGAGLGLINNCAGVFFSPVCNDLGFEMGEFTLYRTLFTLCQALLMPVVAKLFRKYDARVLVSAATVIMGGTSIMMGSFTELWQWYVFGIIQGGASAFISVIPAPLIIGNWFYKQTGTAVGIAAAFSGLVGMLGSSGLGFLIPAVGWRMSYVIIGVIAMVLILPFSMFVLRYKPEEKGMLPYGAESMPAAEIKKESSAAKEKLSDFIRQPLFLISLVTYACCLISSYLTSFLPSCGLEVGMEMGMAAMLASLALCGNMTSKLFLGKLCDSCGVMKIFILSIIVAGIGHVMIFMGIPAVMLPGSLLYGVTMPLSTVLMPMFCRLFWKGDTYAAAYSYVTMFGMLFCSPFGSWFGTFYDLTGSYDLTNGFCFFTLVVALVLVVVTGGILKKKDVSGAAA